MSVHVMIGKLAHCTITGQEAPLSTCHSCRHINKHLFKKLFFRSLTARMSR
ncbi:hypothetical protein Mapa_000408 [Marchantia paleacea]|nr:hypothetical protein Mapa_000408 [Marchantia paleacea]